MLPVSVPAMVVIQFKGANANRSAEVTFSQAASGEDLVLKLSNISSSDVLVQSDVLTSTFFTLAGKPTLTPKSVILADGSTVLFGSSGPGGNVGREWAYKQGLTGAPGGAQSGVSSAGLGLFGSGDLFPGYQFTHNPPDGIGYGITSAGDNPSTGQRAVTGSNPLIKDTVVLTLGVPCGYTLTVVDDVIAQYGTSLSDPAIVFIPEPGSAVLMLAGMAMVGMTMRRRVRS